MDRIHLGQVPRTHRGQIHYRAIPSVQVKLMVAEEELRQLNSRISRHHNPTDTFYFPDIEGRLDRKAFLERCISEWRSLLGE